MFLPPIDDVWDKISDDAKDLIKKLLCDENKRLSAKQALNHPWLRDEEIKKKVEKILKADVVSYMEPPLKSQLSFEVSNMSVAQKRPHSSNSESGEIEFATNENKAVNPFKKQKLLS